MIFCPYDSNEKGSYSRYSTPYFFLSRTFEWRWVWDEQFKGPFPRVRLSVDGVWQEWTTASSGYLFKFVDVAIGHHVVDGAEAEDGTAMEVLCKGFLVNDTGAPLPDSMQKPWTGVDRFEMTYAQLVPGVAQAIWPQPDPVSMPFKPRVIETVTERLPRSKQWVRNFHSNVSSEQSPEWVEVPTFSMSTPVAQRKGDKFLHRGQKYLYTEATIFGGGFAPGLHPPGVTVRDGLRGVCTIGYAYAGKIRLPGTSQMFFTETNGAFRVQWLKNLPPTIPNPPDPRNPFLGIEGEIRTLLGWRVKNGELKAHPGILSDRYMYIPKNSSKAEVDRYDAHLDFYNSKWEHVGDWKLVKGRKTFAGLWGFAQARRMPDGSIFNRDGLDFWFFDTNNNRVLFGNAWTVHPAFYKPASFPPVGYVSPPDATGEMQVADFIGNADGTPMPRLCDECWDGDVRPQDERLWWSNFEGDSIASAKLDGTDAKIEHACVYHPSNAELGVPKQLDHGLKPDVLRPMFPLVEGKANEVSCIRPQCLRVNSKGEVVYVMRHLYQLVAYNPDTKTQRLIANLPVYALGTPSSSTNDFSMDIDVQGTVGPKDAIYLNGWHEADFVVLDDGSGKVSRLFFNSGAALSNGPAEKIKGPEYGWLVAVGGGREVGSGNAAGDQNIERTKQQPTDIEIDDARWRRGRNGYHAATRCYLLHGPGFQGRLGYPTADKLNQMSDAEIRAYLLSWGVGPAIVDDTVYFIRCIAIDNEKGELNVPSLPPVIKVFTCDGKDALASTADLQVLADPGQTFTIAWEADADTFQLDGVTQPLKGTVQYKAPTTPGVVVPYAANADRVDGQTTAKLIYFTVRGVIVEPPPPPPPPPPPDPTPADLKFISVSLVAADPKYGPRPPASGLRAVGLSLHGTGGNEGDFGDLYNALCGPALGGNDIPIQVWRVKTDGNRIVIVPCDPGRTPANTVFRTFHLGWAPSSAGPVTPFTERRYLAILNWAREKYPYLDWSQCTVSGNSMGACGAVFWGARHPEMFGMAGGTGPRWLAMGVSLWNGGRGRYANFKKYSGAQDTIAGPIAMMDGSNYEDYADVIKGILDPSRPMPFWKWGWAWDDASGLMDRRYELQAINALNAAERGYVCVWNGGGHSETGRNVPKIDATYSSAWFKVGLGYPVLLNSSLNDDPATADSGGINLGYEWRNVVESASGFSCELRQRNADCTVTVKPCSKVFNGGTKKNLTLVKDVWQTVSFTGAAPVRTPVVDATVKNATSITADGQPVTLPVTLTITADRTVKFKATGPGGTVEKSLFIPVNKP